MIIVTSSFSIRSVFKMFSVHTKVGLTIKIKLHIQISQRRVDAVSLMSFDGPTLVCLTVIKDLSDTVINDLLDTVKGEIFTASLSFYQFLQN